MGPNISPVSTSTQLSVLSGSTTLNNISSNTLNANGYGIYVQGRYAYLADNGTTNAFEIWDVSNPASPVRVSSNTLNATGENIYVQGRYAYIVGGSTNGFEVWDVSNPASPVRVSSNTLNAIGEGIYVQGRYAFITDAGGTNAFEVLGRLQPCFPGEGFLKHPQRERLRHLRAGPLCLYCRRHRHKRLRGMGRLQPCFSGARLAEYAQWV